MENLSDGALGRIRANSNTSLMLLECMSCVDLDVTAIAYWLGEGADVDIKDTDDRTPLYYAVSKGHEAVGRLLLQYGAGPEGLIHPSLTHTELSGFEWSRSYSPRP